MHIINYDRKCDPLTGSYSRGIFLVVGETVALDFALGRSAPLWHGYTRYGAFFAVFTQLGFELLEGPVIK